MQKNRKCIIYTRVSSKEQLLTNYSIEAQTRYCEEYAYKQGFTEIIHMGGVSESAKDENRKEYKEMLKYALDKKNNVETIFVYSIDRFSRHLASAVPDIEKLKKKNIELFSVQEQISTNSDMGKYFINFKLNTSEFENNLRSSRTIAGIKSRVKLGEYPFAIPPIGYDKDENKRLIINEDGELIRKAFKMLFDGYPMTHIMKVMNQYGITKSINRWGEIFRNPIYAGLIVSKANDNIPVKGVHEPLISEKEFNCLQNFLSFKSKPRLKATETKDIFPMKTLLQCPHGHGKLTGDIKKSKKNQPAYYKCNKCSFTASAQKTNNAFLNLLSTIEFNQVFTDEFKNILDSEFESNFRELTSKKNKLKKEINAKETRLKNILDDMYAETNKRKADILDNLYQEHSESLEEMQNQLSIVTVQLPEKDSFIEDCLNELNIENLWEMAEYMDKQQIFVSVFKNKPFIVNNNHKIGLSDFNLNTAFKFNWAEYAEKNHLIKGLY